MLFTLLHESKEADIQKHNIVDSEPDPQACPQPPAVEPDKKPAKRPAGKRSCQLDATAEKKIHSGASI